MSVIFLVHLLFAAFMTGVAWFVQLVHYPTLAQLNKEQYERYNELHLKPTTFITFPTMLFELISGAWILLDDAPDNLFIWFTINLAMILIIWVSTMVVQVPLHFKIAGDPSKKSVRKLIRSNWLRTILWTSKLILIASVFISEIMNVGKFYF